MNRKILATIILFATVLTACGQTKSTTTIVGEDVVTDEDFSEDLNAIEDVSTTAMSIAEEITAKAANAAETIAEDNTDNASIEASEELTKEAKMANELVEATNKYRAELGLNQLEVSDVLVADAAVRAVEATVYWSHTRPDGSKWYTVDDANMYGENLSKGFDTTEKIMTAWKNSPTHNDNLVEPAFNTIGIFVTVDKDGVVYVAQEFGY